MKRAADFWQHERVDLVRRSMQLVVAESIRVDPTHAEPELALSAYDIAVRREPDVEPIAALPRTVIQPRDAILAVCRFGNQPCVDFRDGIEERLRRIWVRASRAAAETTPLVLLAAAAWTGVVSSNARQVLPRSVEVRALGCGTAALRSVYLLAVGAIASLRPPNEVVACPRA